MKQLQTITRTKTFQLLLLFSSFLKYVRNTVAPPSKSLCQIYRNYFLLF